MLCGLLLTAAVCFLSASIGDAAQVPPELMKLRAERAQMALDLSEPISICVARHDTSNPAFHGCIDWHSAVHGTWALVAYGWATKDERYRPLIESILQPALLANERKHVEDDPDFEMPYGRAWFLRLAIDYRRAFNNDLLDAFADEIAESLVKYYSRVPPDPMSVAYQNATWALINLYDYGESRHNPRLVDFVKDEIRANYLRSGSCPGQTAEVATQEFMAICTNWAWLVEKVLSREKFASWLAGFLPPDHPLEPIRDPATAHQTGLNFSRAWGLWNIYWRTDDRRYLSSYLRHFTETYSNVSLWKGDYDSVAHWVAQFGMLDLILTYYDWP